MALQPISIPQGSAPLQKMIAFGGGGGGLYGLSNHYCRSTEAKPSVKMEALAVFSMLLPALADSWARGRPSDMEPTDGFGGSWL